MGGGGGGEKKEEDGWLLADNRELKRRKWKEGPEEVKRMNWRRVEVGNRS